MMPCFQQCNHFFRNSWDIIFYLNDWQNVVSRSIATHSLEVCVNSDHCLPKCVNKLWEIQIPWAVYWHPFCFTCYEVSVCQCIEAIFFLLEHFLYFKKCVFVLYLKRFKVLICTLEIDVLYNKLFCVKAPLASCYDLWKWCQYMNIGNIIL